MHYKRDPVQPIPFVVYLIFLTCFSHYLWCVHDPYRRHGFHVILIAVDFLFMASAMILAKQKNNALLGSIVWITIFIMLILSFRCC
jgi:hypothetical protein